MKKINRLLKNKDFKNVLDAKKSVACGEFVVYVKNNEFSCLRAGISVSSKIGNSVVRHKIKRQISEMITELYDMNVCKDLVIIVRKKYLESDFHGNKENLRKMLNKINERW